jgi:hercynine metabolism protein
MSWLDELEARLEQQLEAFLSSNPAQEALLREQEARDRQARLIGRRRQLQLEAERMRTELLQRAGEIHQWRQRLERARGAGAHELAQRAEVHLNTLGEQGRLLWQQLEERGREFGQLEQELNQLSQQARPHATPGDGDLERAWAAFETEQELEQLRGVSKT